MQDLQTGLKCTGSYYGELNRKHTEGVDDETRNWGKKINHQLSAEQCLTEHFLVFQCHTVCFLHINQVINNIFHSVPPISILLFFMNTSEFLLKECMDSQHQAASCSAGPHVCWPWQTQTWYTGHDHLIGSIAVLIFTAEHFQLSDLFFFWTVHLCLIWNWLNASIGAMFSTLPLTHSLWRQSYKCVWGCDTLLWP